jgi:hypothetical protein
MERQAGIVLVWEITVDVGENFTARKRAAATATRTLCCLSAVAAESGDNGA